MSYVDGEGAYEWRRVPSVVPRSPFVGRARQAPKQFNNVPQSAVLEELPPYVPTERIRDEPPRVDVPVLSTGAVRALTGEQPREFVDWLHSALWAQSPEPPESITPTLKSLGMTYSDYLVLRRRVRTGEDIVQPHEKVSAYYEWLANNDAAVPDDARADLLESYTTLSKVKDSVTPEQYRALVRSWTEKAEAVGVTRRPPKPPTAQDRARQSIVYNPNTGAYVLMTKRNDADYAIVIDREEPLRVDTIPSDGGDIKVLRQGSKVISVLGGTGEVAVDIVESEGQKYRVIRSGNKIYSVTPLDGGVTMQELREALKDAENVMVWQQKTPADPDYTQELMKVARERLQLMRQLRSELTQQPGVVKAGEQYEPGLARPTEQRVPSAAVDEWFVGPSGQVQPVDPVKQFISMSPGRSISGMSVEAFRDSVNVNVAKGAAGKSNRITLSPLPVAEKGGQLKGKSYVITPDDYPLLGLNGTPVVMSPSATLMHVSFDDDAKKMAANPTVMVGDKEESYRMTYTGKVDWTEPLTYVYLTPAQRTKVKGFAERVLEDTLKQKLELEKSISKQDMDPAVWNRLQAIDDRLKSWTLVRDSVENAEKWDLIHGVLNKHYELARGIVNDVMANPDRPRLPRETPSFQALKNEVGEEVAERFLDAVIDYAGYRSAMPSINDAVIRAMNKTVERAKGRHK